MQPEQQLNRWQKSWHLMKGAWSALKLDKELFALPLISMGINTAIIILVALGAMVAMATGNFEHLFMSSTTNTYDASGAIVGSQSSGNTSPLGYAVMIALGIVLAAVNALFTGAVIHGALERFRGNDPTVKSCLAAARQRFGSLLAFAAFSFGIGYILSVIAERIPFIGGRIVMWLANAAWQVASFFALPVIMSSDTPVNPVAATKRSIGILKQIWGESLILTASIGLVGGILAFAYMMIGSILVATAGLLAGGFAAVGSGVVLFIGLIGMAIVLSMLDAYVKSALYYYASTGESPAHFDSQLMKQAFTQKQARKVFGL